MNSEIQCLQSTQMWLHITHQGVQATRGFLYQNYLVPDVRSIYTRYCFMYSPSALAELLTSS